MQHACMVRNAHKILVGKFEGKGPLGSPRRRWEDNIRLDLTEIGWEGVDWIHLACYRTVTCVLLTR